MCSHLFNSKHLFIICMFYSDYLIEYWIFNIKISYIISFSRNDTPNEVMDKGILKRKFLHTNIDKDYKTYVYSEFFLYLSPPNRIIVIVHTQIV